MKMNAILTPVIPVVLVALLTGCSTDRRTNYDTAMRGTVSSLRAGDFDAASASLQTAAHNADDKSQRDKIANLATLVSGAEAYCRGDRSEAGAVWSSTKSQAIRSTLSANQASLGVVITAAKSEGGN